MFRFQNFHFDFISFWIGFIIASFFWWLFSQARNWYPKFREAINRRLKAARDKNLSGIDLLVRQTTLRQARRFHLAQAFFH